MKSYSNTFSSYKYWKVKRLDGYKDFKCDMCTLYINISWILLPSILHVQFFLLWCYWGLWIIEYFYWNALRLSRQSNADRCRYVDMSHICFQLMCIYTYRFSFVCIISNSSGAVILTPNKCGIHIGKDTDVNLKYRNGVQNHSTELHDNYEKQSSGNRKKAEGT